MSDVGVHIRCDRSELEVAKRTILELQDKKIRVKFDTQQAVAPLRREIDKLKNQKLSLKFDTQRGVSAIDRQIMQLKNKITAIKLNPNMGTQAVNNLSREINKIQGKKVELQFDFAKLKNDIYGTTADVADKLTAAFNKKWGTNVSKNAFGGLDNIDQVLNKIELLNAAMQKVQNKKIKIQLDAKSKIDEINSQIQRLTAKKNKLKLEAELDRKQIDSEISALEKQKREIEMRAKAETAELDKKLADEQNKSRWITFKMRLQGYADVYNKIQGLTSRLGSTTISLGNALTKATSPINAVMRGAMYRVGYGAINKLYEGFGGTFERYDTMHSYATVMKELGYSSKQSNKAIEELEQSVLGLPTGLDEIVAAQRTYVSASGDMEKATKMAIAANNAFISGGLDETRQRFSERQLQNLMSGADLTAMQWDSLRKNMPLAMQAVAKELGYAKKDSGKMVTDLKQGNLEANKFVDAFIKVGNEGVIADAAQVMKTTFTGLIANITNAAKRMGTNIIETLDDVMEKSTGRNLIQTLLGVDKKGNDMGDGIKHFIDDISKSVQTWIRANPDKILGFMDKIRSYDWKGLLSGMAEGFMEAGKFGVKMFEAFSKISASGFGKWMVKLNMIGRVLQVLGMGLKGLSPAFGGAGVLLKFASRANLISKAGSAIGKIVGVFAGLGGKATKAVVGASAFSKLSGVWGKVRTALSGAQSVGKAAEDAASISWQSTIASKLGTAAEMLASGGAIWMVMKGIRDISGIDIPDNIGSILAKVSTAIGGLTSVYAVLGKFVTNNPMAIGGGLAAGAMGLMAGGTIDLVLDGVKRLGEGIKDMAEGVKTLSTIKPVNGSRFDAVVDSVKEIAPKLKDIYTVLNKNRPNNTMATDIERYITNMSKSLKKLTGFDKVLKDVAEIKLDQATVNVVTTRLGQFEGVFDALSESMEHLFGNDSTILPRQEGGTGSTRLAQKGMAGKYKEYVTAMKKALTAVSEMFTEMDSFNEQIKAYMHSTGNDYQIGKKNPYEVIEERFQKFGDFIGRLGEDGGFFYQIEKSYKTLGKANTKKMATVFTGLKTTFEEMDKFQKILDGSMFDVSDERNLNSFGTAAQVGTRGFSGTAMNLIPASGDSPLDVFMEQIRLFASKMAEIGTYIQEIPDDFGDNAKNLSNAIESIKGVVTKLSDMQIEMAGISAVGGGEGIGDAFSGIGDAIISLTANLSVALEDMSGVQEGAEQLKAAGKELSSAVKTIGDIDTSTLSSTATKLTEGFTKIKTAYNKMANFDFEPINIEIKVKVGLNVDGVGKVTNGFDKTMQYIKNYIDSYKAEWDKKIKVNLTAKVPTGAVTSYISSQIRQAVANAQSVYHKSISINVSTNITNTVTETINRIQRENLIKAGASGVARADSRRVATGGYIGKHSTLYRANGGSILGSLFKPKGTDTVPAMLTPGEYVVRRRAVSYFGAKFMQKINNLDIAGAMKDLSVRAGNNLSQGNTTIINHNDNRVDNRKVVQNFSGGSDERTGYMRANRYLMGLR